MPRGEMVRVNPSRFSALRTQLGLAKLDFESLADRTFSRKTISHIEAGRPVLSTTVKSLFEKLHLPITYYTSTLPLEIADSDQLYDAHIAPLLQLECGVDETKAQNLRIVQEFLAQHSDSLTLQLPVSRFCQESPQAEKTRKAHLMPMGFFDQIEFVARELTSDRTPADAAPTDLYLGSNYPREIVGLAIHIESKLDNQITAFYRSMVFESIRCLTFEREHVIKPPAVWGESAKELLIIAFARDSFEVAAQAYHEYLRAGGQAKLVCVSPRSPGKANAANATKAFLELCGLPADRIQAINSNRGTFDQAAEAVLVAKENAASNVVFICDPVRAARIYYNLKVSAGETFDAPRVFAVPARSKMTLAMLQRNTFARHTMLLNALSELAKLLFDLHYEKPESVDYVDLAAFK